MFPRLSSKNQFSFISIFLVFVIIITINYQTQSPPPSNILNVTNFKYANTPFKQKLFNERLSSYYRAYHDFSSVCNITNTTSEDQEQDFRVIPPLLKRLRQEIVPYPSEYFYGRGIVFTIGPNQFKFTKINLKLIELTATKLPVQIWYSSAEIPYKNMTELFRLVPNLNVTACCFITAECRSLTQVWKLDPTHVYKPRIGYLPYKSFPYKPAAIISATFEEVLFLDCDAFVTRDPEELFFTDPMYLTFGALFYPDPFRTRQYPAVFNLFNTTCTPDEYEFDSSVILVNKRQVWDGLYMTKLMNDHHESFYVRVTDGDKDTFRYGFRYMQVKYYLVMTPCSTGAINGTYFYGLTLCKTDSLSQHIYFNHMNLFKYEPFNYSAVNLGYTRIGLGDPNNNKFYFQHCLYPKRAAYVFHVLKEPIPEMMVYNCYGGGIPMEEMEDHVYGLNEPLLHEKSKINEVLMSKTNNVMLNFADNFLRLRKQLFNDQFDGSGA